MNQTSNNGNNAVPLFIDSESRVTFSTAEIVLIFAVWNIVDLDYRLAEPGDQSEESVIAMDASFLGIVCRAAYDRRDA